MDTSGYPIQAIVAGRVSAAMVTRGYSEKKLSEATQIARVTLRRRLAGTSASFTVNELAAIAAELDYPLAYFLTIDDEGDAA